MSDVLRLPPFPVLTWDKFHWSGEILLPFWAGFQSRRGSYGGLDSTEPAGERFSLTIDVPNDEVSSPPTIAQANAFEYLQQNSNLIGEKIVQSIFVEYPKWRKEYFGDGDTEDMPRIRHASDLQKLIGLNSIHLLNVVLQDVAYIGYELGCTWDGEHGVGVMMHRDRVVKVGGADTSFLGWIAEEDSESHL